MGKLLMLFCMVSMLAAASIGAGAEIADAADQPDEQGRLEFEAGGGDWRWEHACETANTENLPFQSFSITISVTFREMDYAELAKLGIWFFSPQEEFRDRFAASPNDPSIGADLLKYFSDFIEPDVKLKALDAVCTAIRSKDESIIKRYESGPDSIFLHRVTKLFSMCRWQDALDAAESDAEYLEKDRVQTRMSQIKVLCLYILGRGEEAQEITAELIQAHGPSESPFDPNGIWFMLDREFTDWP